MTDVCTPTDSIVSSQPYDDPFDIMRFRECELLHSRWAISGSWAPPPRAPRGSPGRTRARWSSNSNASDSVAGLSVSALTTIEVLLMGYLEVARSAELDQDKRMDPGGAFDPLGYASNADKAEVFRLKEAELKHGRLAMVGMVIISLESATGIFGGGVLPSN